MQRIMQPCGNLRGVAFAFCLFSAVAVFCRAQLPAAPRSFTWVKTDPEVESALQEAKQALTQNRLADAVKLYQTLVEQGADLLYPLEPNLYVPVAQVARAALRAAAPTLSAPYRQAYEPLARAQFLQARAAFDAPALRAIAARWPLTETAPQALEAAGWTYFDRGEFARAADSWLDLARDFGAPLNVRAALVVALAQSGRRGEAEQQWEQLRKEFPNATAVLGGETVVVEAFLARYLAAVPAPSRVVRPSDPHDAADWEPIVDPQWVYDTGERLLRWETAILRRQGNWVMLPNGQWVGASDLALSAARGFPLLPVLVAEPEAPLESVRVLVRSRRRIGCLDLAGGRLLWQAEAPMGAEETFDPEAEETFTISVSDGHVFALETFGAAPDAAWMRGAAAEGDRFAMSSVLAARDLASGKLLWRIGRGEGDGDFLKGARFVSVPTVAGGRAYLLARHSQGIYLLCLDARDGRLVWKTYVSQQPFFAETAPGLAGGGQQLLAAPLLAQHRLFAVTDAGVIACADADTGGILWVRQYSSAESPTLDARLLLLGRGNPIPASARRLGPFNPPLLHNGALCVLPSDSALLFSLDAASGKLLWETPRNGQKYLVGIVSSGNTSRILLAAPSLEALDATDGRRIWAAARRDLLGRPALSRDFVYACAGRDGIGRFSLTDGSLDRMLVPSTPDPVLGNLTLVGGVLLAAAKTQVAAYFDYTTSYQVASRRLQEYPRMPEFYRLRANISLKAGRTREALEDLLRGWALLDADTTVSRSAHERQEWQTALFRAHVANGMRNRAGQKAGLDAAAPFAVTPALQSELAARWARYHEERGAPADAVASLQTILNELPETMLALPNYEAEEQGRFAPGLRRTEVLNTAFAAQEIARLIAHHGAGVYGKIEQTARAALADAVARRDERELRRIPARFPNSDAAEQTWMELARLKFPDSAAAEMLAELASRTRNPARRVEALAALALCRDRIGATDLAESARQGLAAILAANPRLGATRIQFADFNGAAQQIASGQVTATLLSPVAPDLPLPLARAETLRMGELLLENGKGAALTADGSVFLADGERVRRVDLIPSGARVRWEALSVVGQRTLISPHTLERGLRSPWVAKIAYGVLVIADGDQIYGIDLDNGRRLWFEAMADYLRQTPLLAAGRDARGEGLVIWLARPDTLKAVNARTGKGIWETTLPTNDGQGVAPTHLWEMGSHAVVGQLRPARFWSVEIESGKLAAEGRWGGEAQQLLPAPNSTLIAAEPTSVSALDTRSGRKLWENSIVGLRPQILAADTQAAYVTSGTRPHDLAAIGLANGKLLWRQTLEGGGRLLIPSMVVAPSAEGPRLVLAVESDANPQAQWLVRRGGAPIFLAMEEGRTRALYWMGLRADDGSIRWHHERPSMPITPEMLFLVLRTRAAARGPTGMFPLPDDLPLWWSQSQVFLLEQVEGNRQRLVARDRFNGQLLQQLELDTPLPTDVEVATLPWAVGGRGRLVKLETGRAGAPGAAPLRAVLTGGALALQSGEEVVILRSQTVERAARKEDAPARSRP